MNKAHSNLTWNLANPINLLALGFGSGLSAKAPGTCGTLAAIPLFLLLSVLSAPIYALLVFLFAIAGIYICSHAAKEANVHDHPAIVWDEFVGFFITMFMVPVSFVSILVGFVLFRIFDIVKPWPISFIDKKVHGGFGIMLDDILAGFAALGCMHLIF